MMCVAEVKDQYVDVSVGLTVSSLFTYFSSNIHMKEGLPFKKKKRKNVFPFKITKLRTLFYLFG